MKKVSLRIRSFDKERFLTYNIDNEACLDEELLDFIEEEEPKGVVAVFFEEGESFDTFSYDVTNKIHLSELSTQEVGAEMVLRVLRSLLLTLIDMTEYRIPLSYLVLHRDYIYVDADYRIEFICIPLEDMQEDVDVNAFLRGYLANIRYNLSEDCSYVAKLLTYVNNTAMFNMRNMVTLVEDLMDEKGIEIPDEESAEIYVDYQEVAEEQNEEDDQTDLEESVAAGADVDGTEEFSDAAEEVSNEESVSEEETFEGAEETVAGAQESAKAAADSIGEGLVDEAEVSGKVELSLKEAEAFSSVAEEEIAHEEESLAEDEEVSEDALLHEETAYTEEDSIKKAEDTPEDELMGGESIKDFIDKRVEEDIPEEVQEKAPKKTLFKTKENNVTGVVIEDDLEEFLAEKEREEKIEHHEESNFKIKKNIKVNRATIVKSTHDEIKAEDVEDEVEELEIPEEVEEVEEPEEETVNTSILSQALGATSVLKGASKVKINPYLIRTNTKERIMITKQNFKIGKASMGVDYSVKGNGAVSRSHATITNKDGNYYIKDNKSTNHTYVNDKMVADGESELLTHDCKIVLGDEEFTFKLR